MRTFWWLSAFLVSRKAASIRNSVSCCSSTPTTFEIFGLDALPAHLRFQLMIEKKRELLFNVPADRLAMRTG